MLVLKEREPAARSLARSLHVCHKVFALLDGGLELADGVSDQLLLKGSQLAQAQVLLNAVFLEEEGRGQEHGTA